MYGATEDGAADGATDGADCVDVVVEEACNGVPIADTSCRGVDVSVEISGCTVFGGTVSGCVVSEARLR